jgi:hypothetical protein
MKKLLLALFISALVIPQISCNNQKTAENNARVKEDSIRRADSIRTDNEARTEREQYQKRLNARIDSLQMRLHEQDSMYDKKSARERKQWQANRERINARINRIKQQKEDVNTVAKDKWTKFKLSVDTAMNNLKSDWNQMLEKMKAK